MYVHFKKSKYFISERDPDTVRSNSSTVYVRAQAEKRVEQLTTVSSGARTQGGGNPGPLSWGFSGTRGRALFCGCGTSSHTVTSFSHSRGGL